MVVFTNGPFVLKEEGTMKPRISLTAGRKLKWLVPLVALALLAGVAGAADRLRIPGDMDLPFYAVGLGHNSDVTWVATVFYRPFETAPGDLVVNQFVLGLDATEYPLSVEGFAVLQEGDFFPMSSSLYNRPDGVVEICFTTAEDYAPAMVNGTTIDELRVMPSLMVGYADFYLEVQQPAGRDVAGGGFSRTIIASGVLEDGRPFFVRHARTAGAYNVEFRFGD